MKPNNPSRTRTRPAAINKHAADPRTPRAIRFSEAEWERVRTAAAKRGISFGSFVREAAMTVAGADSVEDSGQLPPGLVALIEGTYRYTYILATLKREELIREQRGVEVENLVEAARKSQDLLLDRVSEQE